MREACSNTVQNSSSALRLPLPRLAESSFSTAASPAIAFTDEGLYDACGTRIAFTTRKGGVSKAPFEGLNLSYAVGDDEAAVTQNRLLMLEAFDASAFEANLVSPKQVHGSDVIVVDDVSRAQKAASEGADGVVCTRFEVPVLLCFADCVPVILVAPDGAFAVLHAGWRGAYAGIPKAGMRLLADACSCSAADINCYIGPHIGPCCYEVDDELLGKFVASYGKACDAGKRHLDLSAAVRSSLEQAGAVPERISDVNLCTSCSNDLMFSYRAEHGITGRHGAFAMRKEER